MIISALFHGWLAILHYYSMSDLLSTSTYYYYSGIPRRHKLGGTPLISIARSPLDILAQTDVNCLEEDAGESLFSL